MLQLRSAMCTMAQALALRVSQPIVVPQPIRLSASLDDVWLMSFVSASSGSLTLHDVWHRRERCLTGSILEELSCLRNC